MECTQCSTQAADLPASLYSRGTTFRCWEMRENEGRVKASHGTPPQVPHTKTLISSALGGLSPSPPTPCSLHSLNCGVILIHLINYLHALQRLPLSTFCLISLYRILHPRVVFKFRFVKKYFLNGTLSPLKYCRFKYICWIYTRTFFKHQSRLRYKLYVSDNEKGFF